jgi:hypothetical protein
MRDQGISSLHIGGGEPFLDPEGLKTVITRFRENGTDIEYVETNCSWHRSQEETVTLLRELKSLGVDTLLISISPFHNEFIPFSKTTAVISCCEQAGIGVFPWQQHFLSDLGALQPERPHTMDEYEQHFGTGYLERIPQRYWITMRGRALETYAQFMDKVPVFVLLENNPGPCRELFATEHFHVDLYGNYIPGLCSGLALRAEDIDRPVDEYDYPVLSLLLTEGIGGLYRKAVEAWGFSAGSGYVSKCGLCEDIRSCLSGREDVVSNDLSPRGFYSR